jgi:hypothetical protein
MSKLKAREPQEVQPGHSKMLIFGPSGVGKTWMGLSFPKPYYLDTEGGADLKHYQARLKAAGGAYMGPSDGTLDFPTILAEMQALATEKHPYKTLIIDSITKLYQTAISNEAEKLGDKDAFGASKKPAIAYMRRLVSWIDRLDMNVILIAHETAEWGLVNGQRTEVGKEPDVWSKLIYEIDLGLHCVKRGPQRLAIVKKSRLTGFPEGESFALDYGDFATRYGKDFIEAEAKPIILISSQQAEQIEKLLDAVKVDPDFLDKCLKKAGADSVGELNSDQAAAIISALHKKLPTQTK